jgi:hypothetical protein
MTRLQPGAGAIISWGPDCSPRVMTAITASLEPLTEPKLNNEQPGHTLSRTASLSMPHSHSISPGVRTFDVSTLSVPLFLCPHPHLESPILIHTPVSCLGGHFTCEQVCLSLTLHICLKTYSAPRNRSL